jgi:hypothetical protein
MRNTSAEERTEGGEEQQMAMMLKEFTWPLKMSMKDMEATLRMDGTVYDHELQKSWATALQYVRHYTNEMVSAKDAMDLLTIASGCVENATLWQVWIHKAFIQDAGLTRDQIAFRNCVSSLSVPLTFTLTGDDKQEHTVTLRENHLFSTEYDDGLSALEVCEIFKGWKLDPELAKDAMTVLYYTDASGKEWRLSEILELSPFSQKHFPHVPTDFEIATEAARYLELAGQHTDMREQMRVMQAFMQFLEDDCFDYIMRHSMFRQMVLEKCDVIIASHATEYPGLVAVCKDLLATWEPTR